MYPPLVAALWVVIDAAFIVKKQKDITVFKKVYKTNKMHVFHPHPLSERL